MSRRLTDPPVPPRMWDELEAKLQGERTSHKLRRIMPNRAVGRLLAAAAARFVATGVGIVGYQGWLTELGHDHLAVNFANYPTSLMNALRRLNRYFSPNTKDDRQL